MSRFPQTGRKPKNKPLSIFQQARRFYGEAFDVNSSRDLADAMADWSDLGAPERTFTLSHLLYLNLMAQAGVQTLLHELLVTVEDVAEDLGDEGSDEDEEEDDDEDGDEGDEVEDLEDDREPDEELDHDDDEVDELPAEPSDGPPPGVTIPGPMVITPPADEDEPAAGDDGSDPEDLDEGDEG